MLKLAVVLDALGDPNVTVPGPLALDQVSAGVAWILPSSVTVALKIADAGSITAGTGAMVTVGG